MSRVKGGVHALKKRKKVLKAAKGFLWGRKNKERLAREALLHAGNHAFQGRKKKKGDFRRIWQIKIGAATRAQGISYSKFIAGLKTHKIDLDRKILSELAERNPQIFARILETVK